ncbi:MAG: septum formation protein Maf [Gammaproteobacteria bacterium]|nr:MAG: septum formation protein Maf [Gammaproteobacteria bacterium]
MYSFAKDIILASASPYRRELLTRLDLPFTTIPADIDEAGLPGEMPDKMAIRLATEKAWIVARKHPEAVVIGSDQVCAADGRVLHKPLCHEKAVQQLAQFSGNVIYLHSALCVVANGKARQALVTGQVRFRELEKDEIERYLRIEKPYDCAGACKLEGLGITLIDQIDCTDPTALMGMPLIALSKLLRRIGIKIP